METYCVLNNKFPWRDIQDTKLIYDIMARHLKTKHIYLKKGVSESLFLNITQNCILQLFSVLLRIWVEMGACSITCFSCMWYVKTKCFKSKGTDNSILPWSIKKWYPIIFSCFAEGISMRKISTQNLLGQGKSAK